MGLHRLVEPYATGMLDVGDGHSVYWEECGNPEGKPAVFLHGGPGGGALPSARRFFDPDKYRMVLFDQRMCGRSLPHASDPHADLSTNTTWDLVSDIELLRVDRGIDRWLVFGGSWGSTLALAYAETHPESVTELVLRGVFTVRRSEIDWYYNGGAGAFAPEWRERFLAPLGGAAFTGDAISAFHDLLFNPDPAVHGPAGVAWTSWEAATVHLHYDQAEVDAMSDPQFAIAFARIENHFFAHDAWLEPDQLISGVDKIRHIPGVIVQGRYDLACPPTTAWELSKAWPEAELHLLDCGHSATEPLIADQLVAATDRFAS